MSFCTLTLHAGGGSEPGTRPALSPRTAPDRAAVMSTEESENKASKTMTTERPITFEAFMCGLVYS